MGNTEVSARGVVPVDPTVPVFSGWHIQALQRGSYLDPFEFYMHMIA